MSDLANVPSAAVAELAEDVLQSAAKSDPGLATFLGDHRFDAELPDPSPSARDRRIAGVQRQLSDARRLAAGELGLAERVDVETLATRLSDELTQVRDIREPDWNPMLHNPGAALNALLTQDFAPLPERLRSIQGRLEATPAYLAAARGRLTDMPGVFVQTARMQLHGLRRLCETDLPQLAAGSALRDAVSDAAATAVAAVDVHLGWLADAQPAAREEVRLGEQAFAAKLGWTLDTELAPAELLSHAEHELDRVTEQILAAAGQFAGDARPDAATVRRVLDELGREVADDQTILTVCREALAEATAFVHDRELMSVPDEPITVIELPEIDRGIAVAYCRAPGPLETATLPTEFAVSPTPEDWSAERVQSFYREYNVHMLHNLAVHEAMPGHALQLLTARRTGTPVTRTWGNGAFIEGWAVYCEELMAEHGYRRDVSDRAAKAVQLQQLKMQLRTTINTILDIRYHCADLSEAEAMALMTGAGYQEDGEAAGKWRRVQLSSTQLCEYFTGYLEVRSLAADLRQARPGATQSALHDELLSHGSPSARALRLLLGL
ncbi:MAG: DUF885 domain-containing protein [Jatrophihabitans sp.]